MAPKRIEGDRDVCVSTAARGKARRGQEKAAAAGRKARRAALDELSTSASSGSDSELVGAPKAPVKAKADRTTSVQQPAGMLCWLLALLSCARRAPAPAPASGTSAAAAGSTADDLQTTLTSMTVESRPALDEEVSDAETAEPQPLTPGADSAATSSDEEGAAEPSFLAPPPGLSPPPGLAPPGLGFVAPPGLALPPGFSPPPGLPTPAALVAPPPGLEKAPFERRAFRRQLTKIFRELTLSSNSGRAVQQVRDQQVPVESQKDEFVDILTRAVEMHTGCHRRLAMAFVAGLAAGAPSAFERSACLQGLAEFVREVAPSLEDEVFGLESILRSELVPSLRSVFSKVELDQHLPDSLRR